MYVLMAPFSAYDSREWPADRFADLSMRLHAIGIGTVVIASSGQADRLAQTFGRTRATWQYGQPPAVVAKLITGAACVIGNDSGIAHYAGLLGTPTIAVHAGSLPHEYLFGDAPTIRSVTADAVLPGVTTTQRLCGRSPSIACWLPCAK